MRKQKAFFRMAMIVGMLYDQRKPAAGANGAQQESSALRWQLSGGREKQGHSRGHKLKGVGTLGRVGVAGLGLRLAVEQDALGAAAGDVEAAVGVDLQGRRWGGGRVQEVGLMDDRAGEPPRPTLHQYVVRPSRSSVPIAALRPSPCWGCPGRSAIRVPSSRTRWHPRRTGRRGKGSCPGPTTPLRQTRRPR